MVVGSSKRQVDVVEKIGAKDQKQCEVDMSTTPQPSILFQGVKCGVSR